MGRYIKFGNNNNNNVLLHKEANVIHHLCTDYRHIFY